MFQLSASIFDFLSYIPDILRESGNLFGVFALVAILMAAIALLFFKNGEGRQKERVFLYTILFLSSLVIASLFAGLSTGFQSGREVADTNPALVELSPVATRELESYIRAQGDSVTDQSKSAVLSDAIANYTRDEANSASPAFEDITTNDTDNSEQSASTSTSADFTPDGFRIEQKSCSQRDRTIACDLLITNTSEDISIVLFANGNFSDSRLVDGEGNQYIVDTIKVGNTEGQNNQVVAFARDVPVRITLITGSATPETNKISLVELLGSTTDRFSRADTKFQARDIQIAR